MARARGDVGGDEGAPARQEGGRVLGVQFQHHGGVLLRLDPGDGGREDLLAEAGQLAEATQRYDAAATAAGNAGDKVMADLAALAAAHDSSVRAAAPAAAVTAVRVDPAALRSPELVLLRGEPHRA